MLMPVLSRLRPFAAAAATGLALVACGREETPPAPRPVEPAPAAPPAAPAPTLIPAMDRAGLLAALAEAASAYAGGTVSAGQDGLVGRQFSIRSAFGCAGPEPRSPEAPGDGLARWSRDEARETIRLTLTPGDWSESALVAGGDGRWEAVEGFWIPRPWMTAESCPGVRPDPLAGPSTPSPQTAGLAAVFEAGGSRLGRRNGRAYSYTVRGEGDAAPARPADGWRVLMEGRFVAFPDGRAIRCRAAGPDQRPVCVAAVQMDRVAFLTADGTTLGEWRSG